MIDKNKLKVAGINTLIWCICMIISLGILSLILTVFTLLISNKLLLLGAMIVLVLLLVFFIEYKKQ